jgi:hypothetical protein
MSQKQVLSGAITLNILSNAGMFHTPNPQFIPSFKAMYFLERAYADDKQQPRKRAFPPRFPLAHARAPMDDRDAQQARQHGALPRHCLGLGGEACCCMTSFPLFAALSIFNLRLFIVQSLELDCIPLRCGPALVWFGCTWIWMDMVWG